ncbi:16906_t:CDS:2, partial [Gigaspora margarita]
KIGIPCDANTYFTDITNWHLVQQKRTVPIDFSIQVHHYHQYLFLGTSSIQTSNFKSISYNTINSEVIENIENAKVTKILKICKILKNFEEKF